MDASEARPDADPPVGARVVVRHRLPSPDPLTGATLTDVVGDLVMVDREVFVVSSRRGEVRVRRADVTVVKVVPPRPSRRGAPHRALSVEDLQRVMVGAWPPMQTQRLGDWLMRASRGFTQRANSVLAVGDPGVPLAAALDEVERWYTAHGLPPNLTVAVPMGSDPAADPLTGEALTRGYVVRQPTLTLTAATRVVADLVVAHRDSSHTPPRIKLGEELTDEWLAAYGAYREVDEEAARAILTGSPHQVFATAHDGDAVVGVGRLGIADAWGGIAAMWVSPSARHRGTASLLLRALAREARARGVVSLHLQTDEANTPALGLYERHGFERHHVYANVARQG